MAIRLNNDEFQMYLFSRKYEGWHAFSQDARTRKTARKLAGLGLIQVNQYSMFVATEPDGTIRERNTDQESYA